MDTTKSNRSNIKYSNSLPSNNGKMNCHMKNINKSQYQKVNNLPSPQVTAANDGFSSLNVAFHIPTILSKRVPLPVIAEAAAVVSEVAQQNGSAAFDFNEEKEKLFKFLESPAPEIFNHPINNQSPINNIQCYNCGNVFKVASFINHLCEYDENQQYIESHHKPTISLSPLLKEQLQLPDEPPCFRLLRENQIRIRRFLKEEVKYEMKEQNVSGSSTIDSDNLNETSSAQLSKKQNGPHECTLCERKFVHASGLTRHMEKHTLDLLPQRNINSNGKSNSNSISNLSGLRVVVKCILCGRIFFEPESALEHLQIHFPPFINSGNECDNSGQFDMKTMDEAIKFLEKEAVTAYLNQDSSFIEKPPRYLKMVILNCVLQCEFCDFLFSEVPYLFVHSACHSPEKRFECFSCKISLKTYKDAITHFQAECVFMRESFKLHNGNIQRYFVCNVCENKFPSLDQLYDHRYSAYHLFPRINKHWKILQLPCEHCEMIFNNAPEAITHFEEKHYKKNKREKEVSNTSKCRPYLCEVCGKSYNQSSHLWQHLRFHRGVKPFACKEPGCTRKFTIRPDLNDHVRKCHTGERPFHCMVCGKRFLTGSVFYQHRLIHRGERRYECEECGKRFYRADALKNHLRIHTGEKPYGCLFCTKYFRQRGDREKHIRARHSRLDANSRVMMQMQKLKLESAAAVAVSEDFNSTQQTQQFLKPNQVSPSNSLTELPNMMSLNNQENIDPFYNKLTRAKKTIKGNNSKRKQILMERIDNESNIIFE